VRVLVLVQVLLLPLVLAGEQVAEASVMRVWV
jgi:hypothetical protein